MQELMTTNRQIQPVYGMNSLIDRFIDYINVKEVTRDSYFVCLRDFIAWLNENCIRQPQREDVLRYVEYLNTPHHRRQRSDRPSNKPMPIIKMSAGTQARYLRAVKMFFKWTASENLYPNIADNILGAKVRADNTKRDPLQKDEAIELLQSIDRSDLVGKRDYAMILLSITAGLRIIEMQRSDIVDLETISGEKVLFIQFKKHN